MQTESGDLEVVTTKLRELNVARPIHVYELGSGRAPANEAEVLPSHDCPAGDFHFLIAWTLRPIVYNTLCADLRELSKMEAADRSSMSAFGESPGAWVYLVILVLCNAVVTLVIISLTGAFYQRCRHRRMVANLGKEQPAVVKVAHGSVTVLVPCYLPNEQHILKGTVTHIMENLEYPEPFLLILCYNTPKPLAAEQELLPALEATRWPNGRTLRVLKVEGSHSKAENLNACLPLITTETLVIYDADHHPDPPSLMFAAEMMRRKDCHCVQGSTYLRYKPTLLAKILDAEFFVIFFCFFPAVQVSPRLPDAPADGATDGLRRPPVPLMAPFPAPP